MRNYFAKSLFEIAKKDKRVVLLSGDIGNRLFDNFKKKYPKRFINCGVAETNMVGVAAGLAANGFLPFIYTITPFLIFKCFEQIKIDLAYSSLKVFIVGTGSGLSYARLGVTHHSMEDLSLMQSIPNMNILCPGDPIEVQACMHIYKKFTGPVYLRLGKKGERIINEKNLILKKFTPNKIYHGSKVAIITIGNTLDIGADIIKNLNKIKIKSTLISLVFLKPLNIKYINQLFKKYKLIVVIEEHSEMGGGAATIRNNVDKIKHYSNKKIITFSSPDRFLGGIGNQKYIRKKIKLDKEYIFQKIIKTLK